MKLFRWMDRQVARPGVLINAHFYDASAFTGDYNEHFFAADGILQLERWVRDNSAQLRNLPEDLTLTSPVARPSKIVCVGLNYADHAKETKAAVPSEPVLFLKATSSLCGPFDKIIIPKHSEKTDWEVELAVIIGKKASYVDETNAMNHVAGYCLHNDVSERAFQLERNGTWDKGKGCDTFAPLGPWLVTKDEIPDIDNLRLWLSVNGKIMQDGNTKNLIFRVPFLVSYISQFMTLLPGDVISTGTPAGVGLGMTPTVYLKAGDLVELGIDGLGSSRQELVSYESTLK